jgi:hypothetical protein
MIELGQNMIREQDNNPAVKIFIIVTCVIHQKRNRGGGLFAQQKPQSLLYILFK